MFLHKQPFFIKKHVLSCFKRQVKENILISLSSYPNINYSNQKMNVVKQHKTTSFQAVDISDLLANGDKALNENRLGDALAIYNQCAQKNPDEVVVYRKLGKTYSHLKDYTSAITNYDKYLQENPEDVDTIVELGEAQRQKGLYSTAIQTFEKATKLQPKNDLARRKLLETRNNLLSVYSPTRGYNEKVEYATKNLNDALNMTTAYLTPEFMKHLANVSVMFGPTASMGGASNIAQYENYKKTITVSDSYIYASPQVIAAYLSHEAIHAKDQDPYTSVYEEQDAYEVATKFWIKHSNGVEDPEMDYAAGLYKQSPKTLRNRVQEIYELRDPSIAKTSPNHPPTKRTFFNPFVKKAASTGLKPCDVIA